MSVRTSATYIAARGSSGLLSLLALSLFARALGPDGYAWFALAAAGSAICVAPLLQPLQQTLGRYLPGGRTTDLTATLARLLGLLIGATFLVALTFEWLLYGSLPSGLAIAAWAVGSTQATFDFAGKYAVSVLMPVRYAAMFVVKSTCMLALAVAVLGFDGSPSAAVAAVCASSLLAAIILGRPVLRASLKGKFSRQWLPPLNRYAMPLGITMFVTALLQWADRFVLAGHVEAAELGVYSAAVDLAQQSIGLMASSLYLAWFPRMVAAHDAVDVAGRSQLTANYVRIFVALLLPALVGVIILSPSLMLVFFGESYADDGSMFLSWVAVIVVLSLFRIFLLDIGLYLADRMHIQLRNVTIGAVLGLGLNLLFVEQYGVWAAIFGTLAGQITAAVLTWLSSRDVISWHLPVTDALRIAVSAGFMALLLWSLRPAGVVELIVSIGLGSVGYGAAMLVLNGAGCRDWLWRRWLQHTIDRGNSL